MKVRNLLLVATGLLCAAGMSAQDYAPAAWRFSEMQVGSAESIFIREMGSTNWNCKAPFRYADDGQGGVGLACPSSQGGDMVGPSTDSYADMSEADKAVFEEFYQSAQIVNGGTENLLCLVGKNATESYPGGVANTKSLPAVTLFWLSGTEMPLASNYRLTIDYRVIAKEDGKISLTVATSAYDGIDQGTDLGDGYRAFDLPVQTAFNAYWTRGVLDFIVKDNTDPNYKELPIAIKMWLGGNMYDNSVILFRSIKLEKIDAIDMNNVPGQALDCDFEDNPSSGVSGVFTNGLIAFGNNGVISVIDAAEPIEVYNAAGVLVSRVNEVSTLVNIPVNQNGLFIVKSGSESRKVVL